MIKKYDENKINRYWQYNNALVKLLDLLNIVCIKQIKPINGRLIP